MMIGRAVTIGVVIGALALGTAIAANIQGAGASTCTEFFKDIADPNFKSGEAFYASWALGYVSRKNMEREASGRTPIKLMVGSVDYPAQLAFLRNWCSAHPNSLYQEAAQALWEYLVQMNGATV